MSDRISNQEHQLAEKQREALKNAFKIHNKNAKRVAEKSGLGNANTIYNFFNGGSNSLSIKTYKKILSVLTQSTLDDLLCIKPKASENKEVFRRPEQVDEASPGDCASTTQKLVNHIAELERALGRKTLELERLGAMARSEHR